MLIFRQSFFMLLLFFISILLISTFIGWGKLIENFAGKNLKGISGKAISGILFSGLIFTVLAFFIPMNMYVEIPVIIIGIFSFFKAKLYLDFYYFSKKNPLILLSVTVSVLFCASFYPFILDHFGYYVPTINWLKDFGIVKGISNLDMILGQMSVWHIFQAAFSNFSDPFFKINAVLLIIYGMYIIENRSWIQLIFVPVLFLFSQSPSTDLPVIVFSMIILNEIVSGNRNLSFLFAFSVFAFAIKPTIIWLPLFVLLHSIFIVKVNYRNLLFGGLVFFLFTIKNLWTFGYPVFPVAILDLGIFWKPNPELLKASSQYALTKTFDEQYSYAEILKFSWLDYIKNWLFLKGIKSAINISFIVILLAFSIYAVFKRKKYLSLICISVLIKSIFILFFSAQYRFFIDVFFVIIFVVLFENIKKKTALLVFTFLTIFFVSMLSFPGFIRQYLPSFQLGRFMSEFNAQQLLKPSNYEYNKFGCYKVGNLKFNISKQYPYNFDTPVPAISESYFFDYQKEGIFPQLIDKNNIRKGFIWKKLNLKEKKEVEKVAEKIKNSYK